MQTALITGGASEIATAIAAELAADGTDVVLADAKLDAARVAAERVDGARALHLDLRDPESVRAVCGDLVRDCDVRFLVNAAAVFTDAEFEDAAEEQWSRDLDVVIGGTFRVCQAVLPAMRAAGRGAVVNIASVNGHRYFGSESYSAAKAGLINLTRSLAVQYGPHGVRINTVSPGTIVNANWRARDRELPGVLERAEALYPLRRLGTPGDVASAVAFLLSDRASWITGTDLAVDGGILAGSSAFVEATQGSAVAPPD